MIRGSGSNVRRAPVLYVDVVQAAPVFVAGPISQRRRVMLRTRRGQFFPTPVPAAVAPSAPAFVAPMLARHRLLPGRTRRGTFTGVPSGPAVCPAGLARRRAVAASRRRGRFLPVVPTVAVPSAPAFVAPILTGGRRRSGLRPRRGRFWAVPWPQGVQVAPEVWATGEASQSGVTGAGSTSGARGRVTPGGASGASSVDDSDHGTVKERKAEGGVSPH